MHDLPPLRALRAFEACYRYHSFTKAASSLNVGQPAISHQIRALEADLGKRLFQKNGASIEPTAEARVFYNTISPALQAIASSARNLRNQGDYQGVQIGSYPGLATYWLSPRLSKLSKEHPQAAIRLITAELDRDLALDGLDCAILFGEGVWEGCESVALIPEEVIAICSPALFDTWCNTNAKTLIEKAPLIDLIDQEDRWVNWRQWKDFQGIGHIEHVPTLSVYNHAISLHQAMTGHGICLAWRGVVADMLDQNLLKALPLPTLLSSRGYHLVARPGFLDSAHGKLLRSYLV